MRIWNFRPAAMIGQPSYSSSACRKIPSSRSSVMAARLVRRSDKRAPLRGTVGSFSARRVTIANRNTEPIAPLSRLAVSRRPVFSTRFRRSRISAEVMSLIGLLPIGAANTCKSQRFFASVASAAPFCFICSMYSSAMRLKVCRAAVSAASLSSFFWTPGRYPYVWEKQG